MLTHPVKLRRSDHSLSAASIAALEKECLDTCTTVSEINLTPFRSLNGGHCENLRGSLRYLHSSLCECKSMALLSQWYGDHIQRPVAYVLERYSRHIHALSMASTMDSDTAGFCTRTVYCECRELCCSDRRQQ